MRHFRLKMVGAALGVVALATLGMAPAQADEIRFWTLTFDNDAVGQAFKDIVSSFEKANPGIKVVSSSARPTSTRRRCALRPIRTRRLTSISCGAVSASAASS